MADNAGMAKRRSQSGRRKPRESAGRARDALARARGRFEATLRPLGLWDAFAAMPQKYRDRVLRQKVGDLRVAVDLGGGRTADPSRRADREALQAALQAAARAGECEVGDARLRTLDFLSVLKTVVLMGESPDRVVTAGLPASVIAFLELAATEGRRLFEEHSPSVLQAAWSALATPLAARARLDGLLFSTQFFERVTPLGKLEHVVHVDARPAEAVRHAIDGQPRRLYRVGEDGADGTIHWVSWDDEQVGDGRSTGPRPVYVQSHALRQLRSRVTLPWAAPYLDCWLAHCLRHPRVVERQAGGDLLVEFRLHEDRLGYLVVTPLIDRVVVRTFLFLTMMPTPEARRLERRLRLSRRDVDWLGLHDLSRFTDTDLGDDPRLRALFAECGCGHLFDLDEDRYLLDPRPFSAEVARYLRLAA